jgi:hypothetical protein
MIGLVLACSLASAPRGPDVDVGGSLIASMDELRFRAPDAKGRAELVDGMVGKAVRFRFDADARGAFFTSNFRGDPAWDRAAGFSFWVTLRHG